MYMRDPILLQDTFEFFNIGLKRGGEPADPYRHLRLPERRERPCVRDESTVRR